MICWSNQITKAPNKSVILSTKSDSFLPLWLFDMNDFESDNSEEKKYKIESFASETDLDT